MSAPGQAVLPPPAPEQLRRSERLCALLRASIAAQGGAIGFDAFMQAALYEPGLGYYTRAEGTPFGPEGDFVTAPELSPLYGRTLARALAPVLAALPRPTLLEFGAGTGRLAVDLLPELEGLGALPERYLVLETSGALRAAQRALVEGELGSALSARVQWLDRLPEPFEGVVLANEVLDAMPVRLLTRGADGLFERVVVVEGDRFAWALRAPDRALAAAVEERLGERWQAWPEGYCTELGLWVGPWLAAVAALLRRGVVWLADYGCARAEYYAPARSGGTLVCHYRHHALFDPLERVGLQDITASVDFTGVAEAADSAGLSVAGYATQAHFLLDCGIDRLLAGLPAAPTAERARLAQQAQRLLLPGEMGERFKVMALARGWDAPLRGFGFADHRHRL